MATAKPILKKKSVSVTSTHFEMRKELNDGTSRFFQKRFTIFSDGTAYVDDGTCNIFESVDAARTRAKLYQTQGYRFVK